MTKQEYSKKIGISIALCVLGFILLIIAAILQNNDSTQPWAYNTLGISFFPLCLISLFILLKNRKSIKEYEDNRKIEKGKKIIEKKEETMTNLNALLGNTKKYSFIVPIVAGIVILTFWGIIPNFLLGNELEEIDILALLFILLASGTSTFATYRSYKRRVEYLELYDYDKETLKNELYSMNEKQKKSFGSFNKNEPSNIDSLLLGLGDKLPQTSDHDMMLRSYLKKTYGLNNIADVIILMIPQVFGLIFIIFDGGLSVLNEGGFWFTYIGLNLLFIMIYIMFKVSQREGKYILNNYKNNGTEVIEYLEKKKLVILGSKSKLNPQINTLKYDIILELVKRSVNNSY